MTKLFLYSLLTIVLTAGNFLIYIKSFVAQATPWMTEWQRGVSANSMWEVTLPVYLILAMATLYGVYWFAKKPMPKRSLLFYSLMAIVTGAANFGIYVWSFVEQAKPYLNEGQLHDAWLMMLQGTLPAYFGFVEIVVFGIWFFKRQKKNLKQNKLGKR